MSEFGAISHERTSPIPKNATTHAGVLHAEGAASTNGRTITTIGDRVDPMTGMAGPIRIVLTIVDRDHFNVEWYTRQADGTEQRTVLMEHTRRQQPPR